MVQGLGEIHPVHPGEHHRLEVRARLIVTVPAPQSVLQQRLRQREPGDALAHLGQLAAQHLAPAPAVRGGERPAEDAPGARPTGGATDEPTARSKGEDRAKGKGKGKGKDKAEDKGKAGDEATGRAKEKEKDKGRG